MRSLKRRKIMNKKLAQKRWLDGHKIRHENWPEEEYIERNMRTGSMLLRPTSSSKTDNYKSKLSYLLGGGHDTGWFMYKKPKPKIKPTSTGLLTKEEAWELLGKGGEIQVYWLGTDRTFRYRMGSSRLLIWDTDFEKWVPVYSYVLQSDERNNIYSYLPAGTHDSILKPKSHTCACCGK